jgi:hypothetical protein
MSSRQKAFARQKFCGWQGTSKLLVLDAEGRARERQAQAEAAATGIVSTQLFSR